MDGSSSKSCLIAHNNNNNKDNNITQVAPFNIEREGKPRDNEFNLSSELFITSLPPCPKSPIKSNFRPACKNVLIHFKERADSGAMQAPLDVSSLVTTALKIQIGPDNLQQ